MERTAIYSPYSPVPPVAHANRDPAKAALFSSKFKKKKIPITLVNEIVPVNNTIFVEEMLHHQD